MVRSFPEVLIAAMERAGVDVVELAAAVDVDEATVYRWRAGTSRPRTARIALIADALKINPIDLAAPLLSEAKRREGDGRRPSRLELAQRLEKVERELAQFRAKRK